MSASDLLRLDTGISVNYRSWPSKAGPDARPLVLVHGLASTLRIWDFVAPLLAARFNVVAYDQRGHAFSDKPDEGYDLDTMLADLRSLVERLGLEKPVIVGHSWGATLALAYAATFPDNLSGAALVDGGIWDMQANPRATWEDIRRDLAPPDLSGLTIEDLMNYARRGRGELRHIPGKFRREFFRSMMEEQADGTIRARLTRDRHLQILKAIWDSHPFELLPKVRCPMLAIVAGGTGIGEREAQFRAVKERGAAEATRRAPGMRIVWMENTVHDIPLQRPAELAKIIGDFFAAEGEAGA